MDSWASRIMMVVCVCAVTLWVGQEAWASGLYLPGHGVRPLGRGGTGTVSAMDMNALWHNPSLLAGVRGHHLLVDLTLVNQSLTFERSPRTYPSGELRTYGAVRNEAALTAIPQLGVASSLGTERLVIGFGVFGPNGARSRYPEDGAQRYVLVDNEDSFVVFAELAAAVRITDWLWVGAGIQNVSARTRIVTVQSAYAGVFGDPEDRDLDMLFQAELESWFNLGGNVGIWAEPIERIQCGLSLQLPLTFRDDDLDYQLRLPSHPFFDDAQLSERGRVGAEFALPMIVRAGLRYVEDDWDIELNVVHERWSPNQSLSVDPEGVEVSGIYAVGTIEAQPIDAPLRYQDTWSVRMGGDVQVLEPLTLRAGALYEQSAVPEETRSVFVADGDKVSLSLGATVALTDTLDLDVGYAHIFYLGGEVDNSDVVQLNPANPEGAIVVANGTY
ncbi:MAG: outer membrane protein transport protein, partial [Myxococcota bacterium]